MPIAQKTFSKMLPLGLALSLFGCAEVKETQELRPPSKPLVSHIYTADPSAHVFNGRIYIYPSHDIDAGYPDDDLGTQYAMRDYHVLSMDSIGGQVQDHGVALKIEDVPWAGKQMWAPDAAHKDGTYYLYFPAKDKNGVFRIGVASSNSPTGPFKAEPEAIPGSFSMDPSVFQDDDGSYYMYFGGIWGGQLQRWEGDNYDSTAADKKGDETAVLPRVAKLNADMKTFAETPRRIQLVDSAGNVFKESQNDKRFFEAAWVHKHNGTYYFSYSTGDTHLIAYATGDNPYGPFTYRGVVLQPVKGWTNHHSIVKVGERWFIFYHDTELSGKNYLRNVKVAELRHNKDGSIQTINPYPGQ